MKHTKNFRESLLESLTDPAEASSYLNAALKDGDTALLLAALKDVAEAQGGMVNLARKAKLNRGNLYRIFSRKGNPSIHNVESILKAFGLRLAVISDTSDFKKAA